MYQRRIFSDICIVTSRGTIYFHKALIAVRCPYLNKLLLDLNELQRQSGLSKISSNSPRHQPHSVKSESVLTLHLPDIQHSSVQQLIESLYSEGRVVGLKSVLKCVEERIEWLTQLCELKKRRVPLQPLDFSAHQQVHQEIWEQLCGRQLSRHSSRNSKCSGAVSRYQSDDCTNIPRFNRKVFHKEKAGRKTYQYNSHPELRSSDCHPSVSSQDALAGLHAPNSQSLEIVDLSTYLQTFNLQTRKRSNTYTISTAGKRARLKSSVASQPSSSLQGHGPLTEHFLSSRSGMPRRLQGCLSSNFFLHSNMKMDDAEEEKQTEQSEACGKGDGALCDEVFQKERKGEAVNSSLCSSDSHDSFTEDSADTQDSHSTCESPILEISDKRGSSPSVEVSSSGNVPSFEVKAPCHANESKENSELTQLGGKSTFPSVREKVKQLENISLESNYSRTSYLRSQSCSEAPAVTKANEKRLSFSGEGNKLHNLVESSSMEVELDGSSMSSSNGTTAETQNTVSGNERTSQSDITCLEDDSKSSPQNMPPRPLVRTRTFEIIELSPSASVPDDKDCETPKPSEASNSQTSNVVLRRKRKPNVPREGFPSTISKPEIVTTDPSQIREMERKQGSLLFEHNFQTFSNIPTTNMMTNTMMSGSLTSDSSMGLTSLFSSMGNSSLLSSMHSISTEPMSRPPSVAFSNVTFDDVKFDPGPVPPARVSAALQHSLQKQSKPIGMRTRSSLDHSSRSPSPDSITLEQRKLIGSGHDQLDPDSLMSGGKSDMKCSFESCGSARKEDFDDEVKEKDEVEARLANIEDSNQTDVKKPIELENKLIHVSSGVSSTSGSPKIVRKAECAPILSGGSTLKRQLSNESKVEAKFDRQVSTSSVKDVDAIPLVCGFVEDPKETSEPQSPTKKDGPEDQPQSMFSMFIDLKQLPSPAKEEKLAPPPDKSKQPPNSVYMFIEAEAPSPKPRRKSKPCSEVIKQEECVATTTTEIAVVSGALTNGTAGANDKPTSSKEDETSQKKGYFMFIEAETPSTSGSPKIKRKPPILTQRKNSSKDSSSSVMSKSAPSDVLLLATKSEIPEKLCSRPILDGNEMTKSVIDRKEFVEQTFTKRNVSLDNKINESSASPRSTKESFVSGIPRPIHLLKSKSCSKVSAFIKVWFPTLIYHS